MIIDRLVGQIKTKNSPITVGLDTAIEYLPEKMTANLKTDAERASAVMEFNVGLIDKLVSVIPAVKVQVAYYEMLGPEGMLCFRETLRYARERGLITVADVKRNDIGATASAYSRAYLPVGAPFETDFITVNGYLGSDGITPFVDDCKKYDKGIFVLVKTSNPSSGELQNKRFENGDTLYGETAKLVDGWGRDLIGESGYSAVGAVVGATYPEEAKVLREKHPNLFFLIPGYGAQGGGAKDIAPCFDAQGGGGIVNNSRGVLCAYKKDKFKGLDYKQAAYNAVIEMMEDLNGRGR